MVLQLFIGLLAIAAASLLVTQGRRRRIWSVLILAGLCGVSYFLLDGLSHSADGGFIYQWLPYKALKADFNISSSQRMQQMFLPLVCLLAALIYFNTVSRAEQHSLHFNTLVLFNFIALILQASSRDFIQLMFAGSMLSVISFYMPDLSSAKKKMFVFNFLAEMAVFMGLSIVYGKTHSVSIASLSEFVHKGWHKDFVAGLLLFAIGCKCGLFLLNGQYFALKDAIINRTIAIMNLSVPLSGLILTAKLQPLLTASSLAREFLPWWIVVSLSVAVVSALLNNNLKAKIIALSLGVYAALLYWIYTDIMVLYTWGPSVIMLNFMAVSIFILALNVVPEETSVLHLGGLWKQAKFSFGTGILILAALTACIADWFGSGTRFFFALGYLFVIAAVMRMSYWGKSRSANEEKAFERGVFLYIVPLGIIAVWLIERNNIFMTPEFGKTIAATLAVLILFPVGWIMRLGSLKIWSLDILSFIYTTFFILPLKFFGRILWLAFDVVVIERNIIGSVSGATSTIVCKMHGLQEVKLFNFIVGILIGLLCMAVYWGYYIYD